MDERQEVVTKTFTREQLSKMSVEDLVKLIGEAGPNAKFTGTAVVKRADGSIKYDDESKKGEFGEESV
jgi:hypothetical protein